jgi:nucleoside 2-deoxyribosyltransferase
MYFLSFMKKAYIAGKLTCESEREFLEQIEKICKKNGFSTYLPHRDAGICKSLKEVDKTFKADITKGLKDCDLIVASLNGLHVGAGTSWELGYAYAKGIPALGIKTDESIKDALEYLSAILIHSMKIVNSFEELEKEIKKMPKNLLSP